MSDRSPTKGDGKELRDAVANKDGPTAARILQEVGSCNWGALYRQMNGGWGGVTGLRIELNSQEETATAFFHGDYGHETDIAIVHDKPCSMKSSK